MAKPKVEIAKVRSEFNQVKVRAVRNGFIVESGSRNTDSIYSTHIASDLDEVIQLIDDLTTEHRVQYNG